MFEHLNVGDEVVLQTKVVGNTDYELAKITSTARNNISIDKIRGVRFSILTGRTVMIYINLRPMELWGVDPDTLKLVAETKTRKLLDLIKS